MTTDFLLDGMLSGTGVRDVTNGGYVEPSAIGLSTSTVADLLAWKEKYEAAHFSDFPAELVAELDEQGLVLLTRAKEELSGRTIGYFSNGRIQRLALRFATGSEANVADLTARSS